MYRESLNYHNSQMVSKSQDIQAISEAYMNVYEEKKVDQDEDGDNDFADVMIARMIAAGVPKEEAIRRVKNKEYNLKDGERGEDIKEATRMRKELGKAGEIATRRELARRSSEHQHSPTVDRTIRAAETASERSKPMRRGESEDQYLERMRGRRETLQNLASSRRKSVRDRPRAGMGVYNRDLKGSDKVLSAVRSRAMAAGTLTPREKTMLNQEFELWVGALLDEGCDLSEYTWDEMYEIYESVLTEGVLGRDGGRLRSREQRTQGALTSSQIASIRARERRSKEKFEAIKAAANRIIAQETGTEGSRGTGKAVRPRDEAPSTDKPTPEAIVRRLKPGDKKDTKAAKAQEIIDALRTQDEKTHRRGAEVLKQVQQEEYLIYEELVSYLLDEGYADGVEEATLILGNASDEWLYEILDEAAKWGRQPAPIKKMRKKENTLLNSPEAEQMFLNALETPLNSPERRKFGRRMERFSNIHDARRSISTRGGKEPLSMPEVGRYK